jgi:hypothetical protein
MVRLISRETTSAIYITPANDSSMTSARAIPVTGRMSLNPTPESTATLRNRSSIHVPGKHHRIEPAVRSNTYFCCAVSKSSVGFPSVVCGQNAKPAKGGPVEINRRTPD